MLPVTGGDHLDGVDSVGVARDVDLGDLAAPARLPIRLCPDGVDREVQILLHTDGVADEVSEVVATTDDHAGLPGIVGYLLEVTGPLLSDGDQLVVVLVLHPHERTCPCTVQQQLPPRIQIPVGDERILFRHRLGEGRDDLVLEDAAQVLGELQRKIEDVLDTVHELAQELGHCGLP